MFFHWISGLYIIIDSTIKVENMVLNNGIKLGNNIYIYDKLDI